MVVPTYNERGRIAELAEAVFARVPRRRGIAGRARHRGRQLAGRHRPVADELARRFRIRVVHRAGKLGLGSAVIEGFTAAEAPIVGVMDADFSHPPDVMPRMLAALRDSERGRGRRQPLRHRRRHVRNWPLRPRDHVARRVPARASADAGAGRHVRLLPDPARAVVHGVRIEAGGFKICLELLLRGRVTSVAEVPYTFVDRTTGQSKMSTREALGYFTQLRQLLWLKLSGRAPHPRYQRVDS